MLRFVSIAAARPRRPVRAALECCWAVRSDACYRSRISTCFEPGGHHRHRYLEPVRCPLGCSATRMVVPDAGEHSNSTNNVYLANVNYYCAV